ncbi:hypothetical protein [Marinobacter psychrophilus]|jgi:TPR repeat protein|uniref:hypothetical protein n=1 Tax=Marinobacter psychrophilus TaxID=330734 RepID=UPI001B6E52CA|nr:hypothetical protein [Marinobacter psychrophilus]MBQ0763590.1 sel1 repeat family protein [Marinobacter psychrophilus]MBQ0845351.1 sel1 repeat family protein [Marinobacter psychrophilus]
MTLNTFRFHTSALLLFIISTCPISAQTRQESAKALFQDGYTLYQQYYGAVAITPLEAAAKLGHAEAAYWVGEILRKRYSFITEEAGTFYRQAADGGEVYAMLRFAQKGNMCGTLRDCDYDRKQWLDRAEAAALARAETGDTVAMMELFSVSWMQGNEKAAFNWTLKAAEAGDAVAQHWLAIGLLSEREMGFYWTEASRRKDILKWLRASAHGGFPKAMTKLAEELRKDRQLKEARYWVEQMAKTDYYDAILEGASQIMMGPDVAEIYGPETSYHFAKARPIEGAALLIALHREKGSQMPLDIIDAYRLHLTPEILEKAEALSKELLVDTPIIYYLPKFGM